MCIAIAAAVLAVSVPVHAESEKGRPKENGILCAYMTVVSVWGAAKACYPERDPEWIEALDEAVAKLDEFVLRNHPEATPELVEEFKEYHGNVWKKYSPDGTCATGGGEYEQFISNWTPGEFMEWVDGWVSVDVVPAFNPCY